LVTAFQRTCLPEELQDTTLSNQGNFVEVRNAHKG
jgi:hypothetical protein